jgi:hypothetical protein
MISMFVAHLLRRYQVRTSIARLCAVGFAVTVATVSHSPQQAEAKDPLGRRWPASQRISINEVDHGEFDALLQKYVDDDGYVDYAAWRRTSVDRGKLQSYLRALSRADRKERASRDAQLAFWINAYNAVTLEGILQVYPTTSIRNHTARLFGYNIWKELPLHVGDEQYALEEIEHELLRNMNEPRIHFAIVCASVGCPRLMKRAYTTETVQDQLADNTRDFFSRSQNLQTDADNRTLHFSSILSWYAEDFGASQAQQLATLRPYLPQRAQRLASDPQTRVRYLDYDWKLNDQAHKPRSASRR